MGFDKKQDVSQYEGSYDLSAENKDAFNLPADYYDGQLSIYLNAPEEEAEQEETEEPEKETTETGSLDWIKWLSLSESVALSGRNTQYSKKVLLERVSHTPN